VQVFIQEEWAMAATHTSKSHTKSDSHDTPNALSTNARKHVKESNFAFPDKRKEPLNDASHVRNAIARFDQVKDVSDDQRASAFKRIKAAAKKFGVEMKETSWKQLGKHPHTANPAS
jgi:hypothetical protein